ncbi:MAG: hypothetical protein GY832_30530 [Chloroflexi bacterium]|nr:hypothetical protein [Chloroflexota bacterium]
MASGLSSINWELAFGAGILFLTLTLTHQLLNYNALILPSEIIGYKRITLWLYTLLVLPGILLHELSHAITALFLLVDVYDFHIGPTATQDGGLSLGYVVLGQADALRHSLIGLSPLITGTSAIFIISEFTFGITGAYDAFAANGWVHAMRALEPSLSDAWGWLAIYLIFAVSSHMFPSPSDRQRWLPSILFLLILFGIGAAVGITGKLTAWLINPINTLFRWLILIFGLTLIIDLPILLLLAAGTRAATKQSRSI